jgi:hypothetical protein
MRLARNLFLLAATAIAMLAIATPAANAIEVTDEPTGNHCSEVSVSADGEHTVSGGCEIHVATEPDTSFDFSGHWEDSGEVVFTQCGNEFNARLHESGNGLIYDQELTGASCGLEACDEANHANIPWPANLMEFGAFEALQYTFCIRGVQQEGTQGNPCTLYIPLVTDSDHEYEFGTLAPGPTLPHSAGAPLQSRCSQNAAISFNGHWAITDTPIEIAH